jgi:hypothetical protein
MGMEQPSPNERDQKTRQGGRRRGPYDDHVRTDKIAMKFQYFQAVSKRFEVFQPPDFIGGKVQLLQIRKARQILDFGDFVVAKNLPSILYDAIREGEGGGGGVRSD